METPAPNGGSLAPRPRLWRPVWTGAVAGVAFVAAVVLAPASRAAIGPDPAFNAELESTARIVDAVPYTNGTFLVVGDFHRIGGVRHNHLALLDTNGVPVPGFHAAIDGDANVFSAAVQGDGRILVSGSFPRVFGTEQGGVIRLLPDGQSDPSFRFEGAVQDSYRVCRVALDPAGRIHLASYAGYRLEVLRMTRDGQVEGDRTFRAMASMRMVGDARPPGIHVLPDGRFYLTGEFDQVWGTTGGERHLAHILKLRPDGTPDPAFDTFLGFMSGLSPLDAGVRASVLLADGRLVVGGRFTEFNGHARAGILALNPDGSLDLGFNPEGVDEATVEAILPMPDGSFVAGGVFRLNGEPSRRMLVRLLADGTLDRGFGDIGLRPGFNQAVLAVTPSGGNRIAVVGQGVGPGDGCPGAVAFRGADGKDSGTVPPIAVAPGYASFITPAPDGTVYVAGSFHLVNGVPRSRLVRLLHDGSLDPTFGGDAGLGYFGPMALLPDRSLLVGSVGGYGLPLLSRLDASGNRDPGFSASGVAGSLVGILPREGGDVLLWGQFEGSSPWIPNPVPPIAGPLALVGPDGTRRTNAIPSYSDLSGANVVIGLPDGGILANMGYRDLVRFNPDYTRDPAWRVHTAEGQTVSLSGAVQAMARDSLGRVVVGGYFSTVGTGTVPGLLRILADGTVDTTFVPRLEQGNIREIQVDTADRIIALGSIAIASSPSSPVSVVRLLPDGSLDPEFPAVGPFAFSLGLRGDDLYVGVIDTTTPSEPSGRILRLNARPAQPPLRWGWTPSARTLGLDAGAGAGTTRWEMSRDLKTWTAVPGVPDGATCSVPVPADDAPLFFRAAR